MFLVVLGIFFDILGTFSGMGFMCWLILVVFGYVDCMGLVINKQNKCAEIV